MEIGIIGSGIVGRTMGSALLQEGHSVVLGTRHLDKEEVILWKKENPNGRIGSFTDAAEAELVILAVNGLAVEDAIHLAGISHFKGKIVIDTTNPVAPEPSVNGVVKFFTDMNSSLMETVQHLLPESYVVKAFNSVGSDYLYKPKFSIRPTMFICGNNERAKQKVTELVTSFGWETEDMGKAEAARGIEPLSMLWCIPGLLHQEWKHAFKLLKS